MEKGPNIVNIIGNAFNQERPLYDIAADLGEIVLEMEREKKYYGEHTKRMQELTMLAEIQGKVFDKALARDIERSNQPKKPHLKIVK